MSLAQTKAEQGPKASIEVKHGADEITGPMGAAIEKMGNHLSEAHKAMMEHHQHQNMMMSEVMRHVSAPKRVVRDKQGKISHTEAIT
jgi:hypothetical protein